MTAMTAVRQPRLVTFVVMRVTALMLAVLVLGHFAVTHVVNDVADTGSSFVARRWSSALWLSWDATMLAAALVHAGCGVWLLIDELCPPRARRAWHVALALGSLTIFGLGCAAIVAAATGGA